MKSENEFINTVKEDKITTISVEFFKTRCGLYCLAAFFIGTLFGFVPTLFVAIPFVLLIYFGVKFKKRK